MKIVLVLFLLLISPITVFSGILPDYDIKVNSMFCHAADIDPSSYPEQLGYFNQEVPKIIHQIWFGDPSKLDNKVNQWKGYACDFNYRHLFWCENNLEEVREFMSSENYGFLSKMLLIKNWWAAADILRLELIKHFGGVYLDCDFSPPTKNGHYVDLELLIDFHGLTLMTEHDGRNIGTGNAIFASNGFIICSPQHPLIISAVNQLAANINSCYSKEKGYDAMYATGPFFLNRVLSGSFNVVPIMYLHSFGML